MRFLTVCVGLALAQMSSSALADSGTGVDTNIGNSSTPGYTPKVYLANPDWTETKRTPTGQMYSFPEARPEAGSFNASIDVGYLYRDDKNRYSKLNEYRDPETNGVYLNSFDVSVKSATSPFYFQINGGGLGKHDQFVFLNVGSFNSWKVKGFYNETPHVFSDTWKGFYSDNGGQWMTPNFVTGPAGVNQGIVAADAALPAIGEIGLIRKKYGVRGEGRVADVWRFFASATQENRDGSRPWGGQNDNMEEVEPVHYVTRNFLAGVQYASGNLAGNVTARYDTFSNDIKQFFIHRGGTVSTTLNLGGLSKYSSYPDNSAMELKGEVSYKLPQFWNSRFNLVAAVGQMRQDDQINTPVPATVPGVFVPAVNSAGALPAALTGGVAVADSNPYWDGTLGTPTSRATGGMKINTELLNFTWTAKPTSDLGVKANYRHWETKNKSGIYYAYNPLTGQWGAGVREEGANNDGTLPGNLGLASAATTCLAPPGFTPPVGCTPLTAAGAAQNLGTIANTIMGERGLAAPPRSVKQDNAMITLSYALGAWGDVEGTYEREEFKRTYRERDKTSENKYKLGYVNNQGLDSLTVRATYEHDQKGGSFYDPTVSGRYPDNFLLIYGYLPTGSTAEHRAAMQTLLTAAAATNAGAGTGALGFPSVANITANTITNTNMAAPGGMMKSDQADRQQNILNFRLNYAATDALDIGFNTQLKRVKYPGNQAVRLGAATDDLDSYTLDMNWQPSPDTQFSAYYTRQKASQTNYLNPTAAAAATVTAANGCGAALVNGVAAASATTDNLYCRVALMRDPNTGYTTDTDTINDVFGLGFQQDFGGAKLGMDWTYNKSNSVINYAFAPGALTAAITATLAGWGNSAADAAAGRGGMPAMKTIQQTVEANLLIPIGSQWTARLMGRYDAFEVSDWHYDYAAQNTGAFRLADYGPANFNTTTVGVFLKYKM